MDDPARVGVIRDHRGQLVCNAEPSRHSGEELLAGVGDDPLAIKRGRRPFLRSR
jgi:hypothetical protein